MLVLKKILHVASNNDNYSTPFTELWKIAPSFGEGRHTYSMLHVHVYMYMYIY